MVLEWLIQYMNINTALLIFILIKVSTLEDVVKQMTDHFEDIELQSPPLFRFFKSGVK